MCKRVKAIVCKKQDLENSWRHPKRNRTWRKRATKRQEAAISTMTFPIYDENLYTLNLQNEIDKANSDTTIWLDGLIAGNMEMVPPSATIRQLAVALQWAKKFSSMKEILVASRDSSPRAGRSLSAVKSFVFRENEGINILEFGGDEKVLAVIHLLFHAEGTFLSRKHYSGSEMSVSTTFLRDLHAAPSESFVVKLAEVMGNFRSLDHMALFWHGVVKELRRIWSDGEHIGGIPLDKAPDLNCCPLYQQLQVINCCVSRKKRRAATSEFVDCPLVENHANESTDIEKKPQSRPLLYAKTSSGEIVQRLGADHPSDNLLMLETGEPIYVPVTQEGPLLTEYLIKENEEFVLETRSVGAGCSQLLSDMQAFKAANPGCILEDFVRWHSPPDWTDAEPGAEADDFFDRGAVSSKRGQLSKRMQKKGNLWLQLWEAAKPIPAVEQTPLYDEDLAVEGILEFLENISPSELFKQLFISLLAVGFIIAEETLSTDKNFSKLFYQCKDFVVSSCGGSLDNKTRDLCQVYESVENMVLNPEEVLKSMNIEEETREMETDSEHLFRILSLIFGGGQVSKSEPSQNCQSEAAQKQGTVWLPSFFGTKTSLL